MCSIFISDKLSHICQLQSYVFFPNAPNYFGKTFGCFKEKK